MQRTHALLQLLLQLTLTVAAHAQFNYITNDGAITITGYTGAGGGVVIPGTINGIPVASIGDTAFLDDLGVTSVSIPDTVTSIGIGSFGYCLNLTSVTQSTNLTSIGFEAFTGCSSLSTFLIPNSVTNIGGEAFAGDDSLSCIAIPGGIQNVPDNLFTGCSSLTNATIPDGVTNIGNQAFYGCTSLDGIIIPPSVITIGNGAFSDCPNLTSVTVPAGVSSVGNFAFDVCTSLRGIYFRGPAPSFGSNMFLGDTNITIYYLPVDPSWASFAATSSVPAVVWQPQEQTADSGFGVRSNQFGFNINWASGMTVIVEACTSLTDHTWQPLQTNTLASDALYFGDPQWANYSNRFYRVRSPVTPTPTPQSQFSYVTNDGAITITRYMGPVAAVVIPSTINGLPVTTMGANAFIFDYGVTSIWIPEGITNIQSSAFALCETLIAVTIPSTVTSIGALPFANCNSLRAITVDPGNSAYSSLDGVLFDKNQTTLLECPGNKQGAYAIPNTVGRIADSAFGACGRLTNIIVPDSVTNLGNSTFFQCGLNSITIPNSITSIGDSAFQECPNLTAVTIPNSVTNIGASAFEVDRKISSITIPDSVISIGNSAFLETALASVTIPRSVTDIGTYAFGLCPQLTAITADPLNPAYSSVGGVLLNKAQTEIIACPEGKTGTYTIPGGVTNLTDQAFGNCPNLTAVYFQGNAPDIGSAVFENDSAIVYYLPGTTGWGQNFGGLSAVLWNPQMQPLNASFGIQTNGIAFNITGPTNLVVVVVATTDLSHPVWSPIQTNTLSGGSSYFSDPQWMNFPARSYRLRSP